MLRADLIKKLQKAPASESKLLRRATDFGGKKMLHSDANSKSMLNVFDLTPDNRRVNRSLSKSAHKNNFETPQAIKANSILSRAINFNDFMETTGASGSKKQSTDGLVQKRKSSRQSAIKTKLNVEKLASKSIRINLHESALTANLLNDESPASLVSSPEPFDSQHYDLSTENDTVHLNTPNQHAIEKGKLIFCCQPF